VSVRFSGIFFGLIASLALLFSVQAQAATVYSFDTPVVGTFASGGTVSLTANGSSETFVVTAPTGNTFNEFAINLQWGATVAPSASYTVTPYTAWAYFPGGFGPFNTVLTGNFGNSLTFTVNNYAGIYNLNVNNLPIWFLAASETNGTPTWAIAADTIETPLPGALPLFAGGLSVFGLLTWRGKRKKAAVAAA
jgi:hypothetical protein